MDAVRAVSGAGDDLADEDDLVVVFADGDGVVFEAREGSLEFGDFVVVRGEEGFGALEGVLVEEFYDGPGDGESVVGAGTAADFVEDDQGFIGSVIEDVGGFVHFDHEGGVTASEFIGGADAREDAVDDADVGVKGGDPRTDLGHEGDEGDLSDVGGFSGHIWAGDEGDLFVIGFEEGIVGDEGVRPCEAESIVTYHLFDDGVSTLFDANEIGVIDRGFGVVPFDG